MVAKCPLHVLNAKATFILVLEYYLMYNLLYLVTFLVIAPHPLSSQIFVFVSLQNLHHRNLQAPFKNPIHQPLICVLVILRALAVRDFLAGSCCFHCRQHQICLMHWIAWGMRPFHLQLVSVNLLGIQFIRIPTNKWL